MSELPVLATLEREFDAQNLAVVTISVSPSADKAREALQSSDAALLTLMDEDARIMRNYSVNATPTTYLIDRDGTIFASKIGYGSTTEKTLRDDIRRLLEE